MNLLTWCFQTLEAYCYFEHGRATGMARKYTRRAPQQMGDQWRFGLLAPTPSAFRQADNIARVPSSRLAVISGANANPDVEFTVTNNGIRIRLPVELIDEKRKVYLGYLACGDENRSNTFAIFMQLLSPQRYVRTSDTGTATLLKMPDSIVPSIVRTEWVYIMKDVERPFRQRTRAGVNIDL